MFNAKSTCVLPFVLPDKATKVLLFQTCIASSTTVAAAAAAKIIPSLAAVVVRRWQTQLLIRVVAEVSQIPGLSFAKNVLTFDCLRIVLLEPIQCVAQGFPDLVNRKPRMSAPYRRQILSAGSLAFHS